MRRVTRKLWVVGYPPLPTHSLKYPRIHGATLLFQCESLIHGACCIVL